jgi:hypothetical protein
MAHRACALTVYVPTEDHDFEALAEDDQPELVPSPQSKRYCKEWLALDVDPPVEYV